MLRTHRIWQEQSIGGKWIDRRMWQQQSIDGKWTDVYEEPQVPILQPELDGDGFIWPGLELRESRDKGKSTGKGVFATRDLPRGMEIPILADPSKYSITHNWQVYDRSHSEGMNKPLIIIDGHPTNDPHNGIDNYGLSITMMINDSGS